MEPAWRGAQGETERRVWSAVLRPAAVELDEQAAELSRAVVPYIGARMPDIVRGAEASEVRRASNEANIRGFAEVLQSGADPAVAATLSPATRALVRDGAKRGIPESELMRSFRLAHAATLRHLHAILAKHAADAKELSLAIDLGSAWTFAYVDAVVCLGEDLYTSEREHWLRSAAASAVETINTILSEQPIDIDVASRRLRYEVRRVHVAAIAWIAAHEEGSDTLALLEAAIGDIAAAIGNQRPLIQPLGILSIAAWISTNATVPSRVLDELRFASATAPGVRVAIGEPAPGIVGFRTSHIEALEAQRIAQLAGRREGRVTRYHDIALCALATANIEHSRRFVQRELGRLASLDDTTRRLAATVRTYLDENGSRGRTAKRLHVHENTVAYRLRQAEELLGRSVEKRTLELRVALALADLVTNASDTNRSASAGNIKHDVPGTIGLSTSPQTS
ncbi:MAG TPA: helix-turn-helix domain-containing protein [Mycobacterium sp.]